MYLFGIKITLRGCLDTCTNKLQSCLLQLHLLESAEVVDYEALEDLISEEVVSTSVLCSVIHAGSSKVTHCQ